MVKMSTPANENPEKNNKSENELWCENLTEFLTTIKSIDAAFDTLYLGLVGK